MVIAARMAMTTTTMRSSTMVKAGELVLALGLSLVLNFMGKEEEGFSPKLEEFSLELKSLPARELGGWLALSFIFTLVKRERKRESLLFWLVCGIVRV